MASLEELPFAVPLLLFLCGKFGIATNVYTNIWAVKISGKQQDAEVIALRNGFRYDKHVSTPKFSF